MIDVTKPCRCECEMTAEVLAAEPLRHLAYAFNSIAVTGGLCPRGQLVVVKAFVREIVGRTGDVGWIQDIINEHAADVVARRPRDT